MVKNPITKSAEFREMLRKERALALRLREAQDLLTKRFPDELAVNEGTVEHYALLLEACRELEQQHVEVSRTIWQFKATWK